MKKARKSLTVLFVSLLVGFTAVVTVPDRSLGGSISYVVDGEGGMVQSGFLPQFDPSLGSLTGVTYSGNVEVFSELGLDEPQSSVSYVSYNATAQFALVYPGQEEFPPGLSAGNTIGTVSIGPRDSFVDVSANVSVSGSVAPYSYSPFYGTGLINVQVGPNITLDVPANNTGFDGAEEELTFTYTYIPYVVVPEPPGLVLASIAALLPLYLIARKRFTKRAGSV